MGFFGLITPPPPAKHYIRYASWGPILWPFLRSSARALAIKAVRGTVAIKGNFGN